MLAETNQRLRPITGRKSSKKFDPVTAFYLSHPKSKFPMVPVALWFYPNIKLGAIRVQENVCGARDPDYGRQMMRGINE